MTRGIAIPVRTRNGRLVMDEGERQTAKLIVLAVGDGDNENPFNFNVGVQYPLFDLADKTAQANVRRSIEAHFARFKAALKARLVSLSFDTGETSGEHKVTVRYQDLETDEEQEATRTVRRV